MAAKKILVLGAKGMLGTVLCEKLKSQPGLQVLTHSQSSSADFNGDLSKLEVVEKILADSQADFCINAMALTDVNLSETNPEKALQLNVRPAENLASAVQRKNRATKIIQISTDHVYDQNNASEFDITIVNNYAQTKYDADLAVEKAGATVLRTNFFGASRSVKKSFSDWIIESLGRGEKLQGFDDVYFSPLHIETLCEEIQRVMQNFKPGIYNLGSRDGFSKYEFMLKLAEHKKLPTHLISAGSYAAAKIPIPRPRDMRMNVSKYEQTFHIKLPTLSEEICKC